MTPALASALLPVLRRIDPETAHRAALMALRIGLAGRDRAADPPSLAVRAFGRTLSNPIGLAAGFDKNAVAVQPLARLGFGFVETGTVTLRPQPGNERPRLFRLDSDRAVINRNGFNNDGIAAYRVRLARLRGRLGVPLGANLGLNKEGAAPERDYAALLASVEGLVDYVVINVSSPNTPGLRDLQAGERLAGVLSSLGGAGLPILVKLAPDLAPASVPETVAAAVSGKAAGLIVSNTTIARPASLSHPAAREAGGLSGAPLFEPSTRLLRRVARLSAGRLLLIGVGGVRSGADALAKIRAGATLVQVYTEFAYAGPALIGRLRRELASSLAAGGFATVEEARGADLLQDETIDGDENHCGI